MNPELHHRWNAERDGQRQSDKPVKNNPAEDVPLNTVLLNQNRPKYNVR